MTVLWICAGLAAIVFALMLYSIAAFRKPSDQPASAHRHNKLLELLWAIVPIAILIGMATPAVKTLMLIDRSRQSALCAPGGPTLRPMSKNTFHGDVRSL